MLNLRTIAVSGAVMIAAHAAAAPQVFPSTYQVPVPPELAAEATSPLRTTVSLDGTTLSLTYTLPLCITGGELNRIVLTGQLDPVGGTYQMVGDKVELSVCRFAPGSLVCTSKYRRDRLIFGAPEAGLTSGPAATPEQRLGRLKVAQLFVDEPRGILSVAVTP